MAGGEQARQAVEAGDLVVIAPRYGSASPVQRHADPERSGLRPAFARRARVAGDDRGQGIGWREEAAWTASPTCL